MAALQHGNLRPSLPRSSQPCRAAPCRQGRLRTGSPWMHHSLSQSSQPFCAPCWAQTPPPAGAVTPDHPAASLKARRPCPGVPVVPSSAPQHRLPTCQLPPRCFPRRQTMVFPGSTNHPDFCSEAWNSSVRAWTGASAVPRSGLLGIRPSAGGLFSTGVPPAPMFWQTGRLQSQVTQSASPSADTCGDGSPDTSHPAQALCPQSSPRSFSCSSGAPAVLHSWGF